jgi:hypothetical protein
MIYRRGAIRLYEEDNPASAGGQSRAWGRRRGKKSASFSEGNPWKRLCITIYHLIFAVAI